MKTRLILGILGLAIIGCGSSGDGGSSTGGSGGTTASGGSASAGSASAGSASAGSVSSGGTSGGATAGQLGGQTAGTGGTAGQTSTGGQTGGATAGSSKTGGTTATAGQTGTGGQAGGGAGGTAGTGGSTKTGGTAGTGSQPDGGLTSTCVPTKTFATVDPTMPGPFKVVVKKDVGPENGNPDAKWNNQKPHFNLYLPDPLGQGYCHPVITWSNGTGDQPPTYEVLIKQLASHGFVVVASLSSQTAAGDPIPPIAGINWMVAENDNPTSDLYQKLDLTKIGATGHSQGGAATTMAGGDPRVTAISPICGARANITFHGPAILICGGADTMVPCKNVQPAFDSVTNVPVMMAEMADTTHGSWIGSIKDPVMVATTGWMRVHLMNDTANRNWFYGPNCKACTDPKWKVQRKMMDQ